MLKGFGFFVDEIFKAYPEHRLKISIENSGADLKDKVLMVIQVFDEPRTDKKWSCSLLMSRNSIGDIRSFHGGDAYDEVWSDMVGEALRMLAEAVSKG